MIAIVDYGLGNLKSVKYALDRLGVDSALTSSGADILAADGVILPGVGAFEEAMRNLRDLSLVTVLREAAATGRPLLGICLGLQLLFSRSQEHGLHDGLNIVPGEVVRFAADLTVPHMGWNQVRQERSCRLFDGVPDGAYFYFAHSYYAVPVDASAAVGRTDYGGAFASVVQSGNVLATQFHPEKSGPMGLRMLTGFCSSCRKT